MIFSAFTRGLGYYDSTDDEDKGKLFGFLFAMSVSFLILNIIRNIILVKGILLGTKKINNKMFESLTRAKAVFFDSTPNGYLMNKFSNDVNLLDNAL